MQIITAMTSGVKSHLTLRIMIYQEIISFLFFKNADTYRKILEVSVFKYVFEIRSISIGKFKY